MAKKFTNNEIKLSEIPNFEHIITKKLEKSYLNIVVINEIIGFIIFAIILGVLFYFIKFFNFSNYKIYYIAGFLIISVLSFFYSLTSFRKKSYAFRDHDVIYKYGVFKESLVIVCPPTRALDQPERSPQVHSSTYLIIPDPYCCLVFLYL